MDTETERGIIELSRSCSSSQGLYDLACMICFSFSYSFLYPFCNTLHMNAPLLHLGKNLAQHIGMWLKHYECDLLH